LDEKMMVRLVVAALCVCALAYGSEFDEAFVPESPEVEPIFQEEALVQVPSVPLRGDAVKRGTVEIHSVVLKKMAKVPPQAGDQNAYSTEAKNQKSQEQTSNAISITKAESSAGLTAASAIMRKEQAVAKQQALKHQVAYSMNIAAKDAAKYKTAVQGLANAKLVVRKEVLVVKAQQQIVKNFEKQLAAARAELRKKESTLTADRLLETKSRWRMEKAGNIYTAAKAKAIRLDNAEKQREQEKRDTKAYMKVAANAVEKAALAHRMALKKVKKVVKKVVKKHNKPKKKKNKCHDCTKLPKQYHKGSKLKGSCADCSSWAKQGFCTKKRYKAFMGDYCKGSCQKVTGKC